MPLPSAEAFPTAEPLSLGSIFPSLPFALCFPLQNTMDIIGDALLSTVIEFLFDKLASSDLMKFARHEDVHTELKKWEKELQSIREELNDAEEKQITQEAVKSWLFDLRDLAYDMEDILDEFAYEVMRRKLMGAEADEASTSKIRRGAAATSAWQRPPPTTPMAYEPDVYGRDEDKTLVLDMLRKVEPNENNVGLISIVGMGGLGKTTLARLVYNDDLAKNFELRAWVCVTEDFDVEKITKAILNSVLNSDASGSLDFQQVQRKLTDTLAGKTLFLILDDVWNENYCNWDRLRAPFSVVAKGSKVIVTTRNKNVALMMGAAENLHELNPLSEDACWSVLRSMHLNIEIWKIIQTWCPLEENCWQVWGIAPSSKSPWCAECEILPALRLSYHYLPSYLKGCFAYCAIFPKDYEYDSKTLVLLWMAEGNNESRFVMHDLICDLARVASGEISFCLEDNLESNHQSTISKETRHSSFIRGKFDVFKKFEAFQGLEHLRTFVALPIQDMPQQIGKLKKLQTLSDFIVSKRGFLGIKELKDLSHLRGEICISKLENVVDVQDARDANLKANLNVERLSMIWSKELDGSHDEDAEMEVLLSLQPHTSLKKLNIEGYGGRQFPNWICDPSYIKLVELSLIGCIRCISVPSVGQLPFLKKLVIKRMDGVKSVGLEFEGQVSLHAKPFQCLESLWFEDMMEWEEWCWSKKSFSCLHQLEIKNCPRLIKKLPTHLTSLVKLSIENCPEMMVPLPTDLPSLEELNIYYCPEMTPQFDNHEFLLMPLRGASRSAIGITSHIYLEVSGISQLSRLQPEFMQSLPRLELLEIDNSGQLQCLWLDGLGLGNLSRLQILSCDQLVSLGEEEEEEQGLPYNLQHLEIRKCDKLEKLPHGLQSYTSLAELIIEDCPKLVSFPEKGFPLMLRGLAISNCESLSSLPDRMMMRNSSNNVCHLEYLEIEECPSLIYFPQGRLPTTLRRLLISNCKLPPTLKKLWIGECEKLESLPEGIMHHHSNNTTNCGLQILDILEGSSLASFPTGKFPSTCKSIMMDNCAQLQPISEEMFHCNNNALEELSISRLPNLKTIPDCLYNLKDLRIEKCENLDLQPHLLRNLTSLASLQITNCENIKVPLSEWGLARLTSLRTLTIGGIFPEATSFSNHHHHFFLLPTTLVELCISSFQNLESLAFLSLQTLTSLRKLGVFQCPKLQSFIPKEGLPDMLSELYIRDCPLLIQRCSKEKGEDWPKIAHIPWCEGEDNANGIQFSNHSEGADQEYYVDLFELNVMGIAPGKGRVCDVGMLLQSSGRPTQLCLGSLSLVKDLTMKKTLAISYTNWSGVGAVPLMSPWQDETSQHSGIEMHGVQADPL
ncbi:putative disease resistance protein RGA1 [Vitis vinifera]|uniref:Putative disease resistance protein RGA1 n=1 Tax=Vitis vinifera TaxID=29760 RepID=A0A438DZ66_VITVI|nr:putative disease resistance protein RGA1 [Vitis vinifera]